MLGRNKKKVAPRSDIAKNDQPTLALQITNRYLRWVLLLLAGVVFFLGYVFVLDAQIADVQNAARESLPAKLKVRDDLKAIKIELDEAVLDYEKIKVSKKAALDRIRLLLPSTSEYGDLFTMLNTLTTLSGMKMVSITITLPDDSKPQQRRGAAAQQPAGTEDDPVTSGLVRALSIQISVEGGTYETFKKYLSNVERNIRLLDIKSLSFEGSSYIPSADGSLPTPRYDIELTTYYQP